MKAWRIFRKFLNDVDFLANIEGPYQAMRKISTACFLLSIIRAQTFSTFLQFRTKVVSTNVSTRRSQISRVQITF